MYKRLLEAPVPTVHGISNANNDYYVVQSRPGLSYIQPPSRIADIFKYELQIAVNQPVQAVDGGRGRIQQPGHDAAGVVVVEQHARQAHY